MIVALGACSVALLFLGWCVLKLATSVDKQAESVQVHGNQLALFGRVVYGSGATGPPAPVPVVGADTVADPDAAALLSSEDQARRSGPP